MVIRSEALFTEPVCIICTNVRIRWELTHLRDKNLQKKILSSWMPRILRLLCRNSQHLSLQVGNDPSVLTV